MAITDTHVDVDDIFPDASEYITFIYMEKREYAADIKKYGCPYSGFTFVFHKLPQDVSTFLLMLEKIMNCEKLKEHHMCPREAVLCCVEEVKAGGRVGITDKEIHYMDVERHDIWKKTSVCFKKLELMAEAVKAHPGEYAIYMG